VRQKVSPENFYCSFLSDRLEFKIKILSTHLVIICAHNSLISITVLPSSDVGVPENVQAITQ